MMVQASAMAKRDGRDLRVLLIAEAANPEWASVPLVGWSHSTAIAALTNAHIVTQVRNRGAFERAGVDQAAFTAIDSERLAAKINRAAEQLGGREGKGWTIRTAMGALSYYYFEHLVWRQFRERLCRGEFDVVHRVTPLSPTVPSLLAKACRRIGVPFVLGPLNGGVPWPAGFDASRRKEREWLSYVRSAHRLLPGYRSTRKSASAILIASRDTWKQMPQRYHEKCVYIPENGLSADRLRPVRTASPGAPLRVVFLGRLVPYKGADMLLDALLPLLREGRVLLTLIGDGPERNRLEAMVRSSGVSSHVEFVGWVEHAQAQAMLHKADVLGFPSVREFGGGVVLEAMAAGVVPVVINYGGPGELVTPQSGYCIDIGSRPQIVGRFREIFSSLAADPSPLVEKAAAAQQRARQQFTWQRKAEQCREVHRWVCGLRPDKPYFGMPLPDIVTPTDRMSNSCEHDLAAVS